MCVLLCVYMCVICVCVYNTDDNEMEIVEQGGLEPIVQCAAMSAQSMDPGAKGAGASSTRELENLEELAAQCARSLRNLSVNRK